MLVSDAIVKAYRESSIKPIGWGNTDISEPEQEEGLYRLNALWRSIRAEALGEVVRDWQVPNKTRTAPHNSDNINQFYPQNLNSFNQPGSYWDDGDDGGGGGINHRQHYPPINTRIVCKNTDTGHTIWFPQFPYDGSRMEIVDIGMAAGIDISGNGRYIGATGTDTVTFNPGDPPIQWLYRADKAVWVVISADLTVDDELPLPAEFDDFFICGLAMRLCALDRIDPQPATVSAYQITERKIKQRYYQPGVMSYGGQNAVPSFQSYNNYWGWGTNFRSGV